jgi:H+/Cl- antiporter ClcA
MLDCLDGNSGFGLMILFLADSFTLLAGKEGPFVHISAAIASLMTKHIPPFRGLRDSVPLLQQLYSSAAAVGVSSSVRAPIGGLLFSVEVRERPGDWAWIAMWT